MPDEKHPVDHLTQEERNEIFAKAIDAWLDKQYAKFGKFALGSILSAVLAYALYYLVTHGWLGKS